MRRTRISLAPRGPRYEALLRELAPLALSLRQGEGTSAEGAGRARR